MRINIVVSFTGPSLLFPLLRTWVKRSRLQRAKEPRIHLKQSRRKAGQNASEASLEAARVKADRVIPKEVAKRSSLYGHLNPPA